MANAPEQAAGEDGETLHVDHPAPAAQNINVDGRKTQSPRQGFGQLWRKTYRLPLIGASVTPQQVAAEWKEHFSDFQPPENHVYPPLRGMKPGEVILIEAETPGAPPISTGVLVIDADDTSFTLATPQGHPEAGWVEFKAETRDDGTVVAQVQSMARASDPLYELAFRLRGSKEQERIWRHVLTALGAHFGVRGKVELNKVRADERLQWSKALNIRHNAMLGTMLHLLTSPIRRLVGERDTK